MLIRHTALYRVVVYSCVTCPGTKLASEFHRTRSSLMFVHPQEHRFFGSVSISVENYMGFLVLATPIPFVNI